MEWDGKERRDRVSRKEMIVMMLLLVTGVSLVMWMVFNAVMTIWGP